MRYDLDLVVLQCAEAGLPAKRNREHVAIALGRCAVLRVENFEGKDDCMIGFEGTPWHFHGDFMFSDSHRCNEMDYLDLLLALGDGRVLVCEVYREGKLTDRSLVHSELNDQLRYMQPDEEVRIWRAAAGHKHSASKG